MALTDDFEDDMKVEKADSEENNFEGGDSEDTYEKDGIPTEEFTNELKEYIKKARPESVETMQANPLESNDNILRLVRYRC